MAKEGTEKRREAERLGSYKDPLLQDRLTL